VSDVHLRVLDDPARAVAELLAETARAGGHMAVCGGTSVGAAFELAAGLEPDWSRVELWWGDERAVPPDDELSNYHVAREALLDRLAAPPGRVHRIEGELGPDVAAARYDRALDGVTLDLALNGIGPDGHTASLFPNAPGLDERDRRAIPAEAALEPFVPRVTMTPPVFAAAHTLLYLVTGAAKAQAARRAFAEPPSNETPASLVRGRRTVALLDRAAASLLPDFSNA
jgi:6-phosphogluconolactonase